MDSGTFDSASRALPPRSRAPVWIRRIALWLLFGACFNFVFALIVSLPGIGLVRPAPDGWPESPPEDIIVFESAVHTYRRSGRVGFVLQNLGGMNGWEEGHTLREFQIGWPYRSVGYQIYENVTRTKRTVELQHGQFLLPGPRRFPISVPDRDFVLPLDVMPEHFAANAVLYALIGVMTTTACQSLRRLIRRKRGLCESCGYSRVGLAPSSGCPECGAAAPRISPKVVRPLADARVS